MKVQGFKPYLIRKNTGSFSVKSRVGGRRCLVIKAPMKTGFGSYEIFAKDPMDALVQYLRL